MSEPAGEDPPEAGDRTGAGDPAPGSEPEPPPWQPRDPDDLPPNPPNA